MLKSSWRITLLALYILTSQLAHAQEEAVELPLEESTWSLTLLQIGGLNNGGRIGAGAHAPLKFMDEFLWFDRAQLELGGNLSLYSFESSLLITPQPELRLTFASERSRFLTSVQLGGDFFFERPKTSAATNNMYFGWHMGMNFYFHLKRNWYFFLGITHISVNNFGGQDLYIGWQKRF